MTQQLTTLNQATELPAYLGKMSTTLRPGQACGLYITVHPEATEATIARFERWFQDRPEIEMIDAGTSDKAGLGFVLLEWMEHDIDPLFLTILDQDEQIGDYTIYGRDL